MQHIVSKTGVYCCIVSAQEPPVNPPSFRLSALESRTVAEFWAFLAATPALRLVGRGDRHPVLVLPGFMADDRSTVPLRWTLRNQGYWVHGWKLGANIPTQIKLDGLRARLNEIYTRHGNPVSLVGWSLGGVLARELARETPEQVRQVITLGSPFRLRGSDRSSLTEMVDRMNLDMVDMLTNQPPEQDRPPLPVPSTAIYSRSDGVIRWHVCIDGPGPLRENIEVRSSHSGLGHNPAAVWAISDRLRRPIDNWRPFKAPIAARCLFPKPMDWHSRIVETV